MKKDEVDLRHVLDAIVDIETFMDNISHGEFLDNKEKQYAVIRALEIIGEATKSLSSKLTTKYPMVPWRDITGMRDKLIHVYFGVKLDLVWETVRTQLPILKKQLSTIRKEIK